MLARKGSSEGLTPVAAPVPGQKGHRCALQFAHGNGIAGLAVGGIRVNHGSLREALYFVKAAAADDGDFRLGVVWH